LALDEVEVAQDAFGLVANDRIDLALDALGGAGGVVHQTADLVEKPIAGLGHLARSGRCELIVTDMTMAIPGERFKGAFQGRPKPRFALSCPPFLAIVSSAQSETGITKQKETPMIDQQIDIATKDGKTTTFITHPERGGPFPVIIFYMDAPAIREELRDMARRLGTSGYYV